MIWGMITFEGKLKIYRIDGTMNLSKYIDLIGTKVFPELVNLGF